MTRFGLAGSDEDFITDQFSQTEFKLTLFRAAHWRII